MVIFITLVSFQMGICIAIFFMSDEFLFLCEWVRQNKQKFLTLVEVNYNGKIHRMVRYNCENNGPRPESYFEDYELVQMHTSNENEKKRLYWELKTGAETGWDYSSRYFFLLINIFKKLSIFNLMNQIWNTLYVLWTL